MRRLQMKREAREDDRARARLRDVEASIRALADEDLLDLADIFQAQPAAMMNIVAQDEMTKRNIRL